MLPPLRLALPRRVVIDSVARQKSAAMIQVSDKASMAVVMVRPD